MLFWFLHSACHPFWQKIKIKIAIKCLEKSAFFTLVDFSCSLNYLPNFVHLWVSIGPKAFSFRGASPGLLTPCCNPRNHGYGPGPWLWRAVSSGVNQKLFFLEPRPQTHFWHIFCAWETHLDATILMIFLTINWPNAYRYGSRTETSDGMISSRPKTAGVPQRRIPSHFEPCSFVLISYVSCICIIIQCVFWLSTVNLLDWLIENRIKNQRNENFQTRYCYGKSSVCPPLCDIDALLSYTLEYYENNFTAD